MKLLNVEIESAGYESEKTIIHNIRFDLHEGELIGLIGQTAQEKAQRLKPFWD